MELPSLGYMFSQTVCDICCWWSYDSETRARKKSKSIYEFETSESYPPEEHVAK